MMAKKVSPIIGLVTCSSELKRLHKLLEEKLLVQNYLRIIHYWSSLNFLPFSIW